MLLHFLWVYFPACRYHEVKDPSWSVLRHFVRFLSFQLQSCQKSGFIDVKEVGDVLAGLKCFVVRFMLRMSRVSLYCVLK